MDYGDEQRAAVVGSEAGFVIGSRRFKFAHLYPRMKFTAVFNSFPRYMQFTTQTVSE